jgi:hypothetical protein
LACERKQCFTNTYTGAAIIPVILVVPVTQDIPAFWSLQLSGIQFHLVRSSQDSSLPVIPVIEDK